MADNHCQNCRFWNLWLSAVIPKFPPYCYTHDGKIKV
jgi:hypothetical protein